MTGGRNVVAALIARLANHYWQADRQTAGALDALAEDYIDDLEEFPVDLVDQACRTWRRGEAGEGTGRFMPKVAELIAIIRPAFNMRVGYIARLRVLAGLSGKLPAGSIMIGRSHTNVLSTWRTPDGRYLLEDGSPDPTKRQPDAGLESEPQRARAAG